MKRVSVAWRSASHPVVEIWRAHGFRWTYGTFDAHHFDGRRAAEGMAGRGRLDRSA